MNAEREDRDPARRSTLVSRSRESVIDVFSFTSPLYYRAKSHSGESMISGLEDIEQGGAGHPSLPGFQIAVHTALVSV